MAHLPKKNEAPRVEGWAMTDLLSRLSSACKLLTENKWQKKDIQWAERHGIMALSIIRILSWPYIEDRDIAKIWAFVSSKEIQLDVIFVLVDNKEHKTIILKPSVSYVYQRCTSKNDIIPEFLWWECCWACLVVSTSMLPSAVQKLTPANKSSVTCLDMSLCLADRIST